MNAQTKQPQRQGERLVRILATDIDANMQIYPGLAKVKGISWNLSNAICKKLGIDKRKRVGELSKEDISKIAEFLKKPDLPAHLLNRQKDFDSGEDKHLVVSDLELRKEFDIKRLKKIKSYRGMRHALKLPLRGQRTKGNFRKNKMKGAGIKKKK